MAGMGNSQIQLGRGESHSQSAKRQTANGQRQSEQKTVAGLVTHANFITLTPGTVSVDVDEKKNVILVHGLTDDFAQGCLEPDMDRKVSGLEGK